MSRHTKKAVIAAIEKSTHDLMLSEFGSGWWRDRLDDIKSRLVRWYGDEDFVSTASARTALIAAWERAREDNAGSAFGEQWWKDMLNSVLRNLDMEDQL